MKHAQALASGEYHWLTLDGKFTILQVSLIISIPLQVRYPCSIHVYDADRPSLPYTLDFF